MRAHGMPNFPDPDSNGVFDLRGLHSQASQQQVANKTCQHLAPNGGQLTQAQRQQTLNQLLKLARCMRSHGYRQFPDPIESGDKIGLTLHGSGISPAIARSPQFQAAQRTCQLQAGLPAGAP